MGRHKSERRKERSDREREHRERYTDERDELYRYRKELERAAHAAKKFKDRYEEQRVINANLEAQLENGEERVRELKSENKSLKSKLDRRNRDRGDSDKLRRAENELIMANARIQILEESKESLMERYQELRKDYKELQTRKLN